jgi:hypothetical protein
MSADLRRVLDLPRRPQPDDTNLRASALIEAMTARYGRGTRRCRCAEIVAARGQRPRKCFERLNLPQAWALYELGIVSGFLGAVQVGAGKTGISILAPLAMPDCKTALLLIPPTLVHQLIDEHELVAEHFRVPTLVTHGSIDFVREVPGAPTLHVLPYSILQLAKSTDWIPRLAPDLIIADEAHKIRNVGSATGGRIVRAFRDDPTMRFCAMSGSITDSSLKDYWHLSLLALRDGSPLPTSLDVTEEWARAIDASDTPAPPGALLEWCTPGEHVRDGYKRRLTETMGVVATHGSSVESSLVIDERVAPPLPPVIEDALNNLRATWQRPDGEELIDALSMSRCARELACGFYYRWKFPLIKGEPQKVGTILNWLEARKLWRKELRQKLRSREVHMDSPLLCTRAAMRHWDGYEPGVREVPTGELDDDGEEIMEEVIDEDRNLPTWDAEHWPRWRDTRNTVTYQTEAVRLDDYLARDASRWAHENTGIVWYAQAELGRWIAEISGLPLHGGGPDAGKFIARATGETSIICSIQSHGTGRDGLQYKFATQLFTSPPSSATVAEQALGRLHRQGQASPEVSAFYYSHTPELEAAIQQAMRRAAYVQRTLGSPQKLLR